MDLEERSRTVADPGVNKSVIVARRMACIDPFIDVTIFPEGLTPDSMPRESFPSPLAFIRALTKWLGGWDGIA